MTHLYAVCPQSRIQGIGTFISKKLANNVLSDARVDKSTHELFLLILPVIVTLAVPEKVMVGHTLLSCPSLIGIKGLRLNTLAFEEIDNLVWNFRKDFVC